VHVVGTKASGLTEHHPALGKTVLIAGGAGFLGSHLCRAHLGLGARVICVDNLVTGRLSNISTLLDLPEFAFHRHDVRTPFVPGEPVHFIFNLASPASPPKYERDPIATLETNVIGSANLLKLAKRTGARILQASTSEVYGDPVISPQTESYRGNVQTMGPRACYDEGKRIAETLFYEFHERSGVDTRVARIFNTYGPMMDPEDGRVVSNFIMQALKGQDLTIYGKGEQTRSFCYVDDLVSGLLSLMYHEGDLSNPVNMGNPGEFTILELAQLVLELTNSRSGLVFLDLPQDDPMQRKPDITRARSVLDWEPKIPLIEGLQLTIPYFAAELGRNARSEE